MDDPVNDIIGSIDEERRLIRASSGHAKRGRHYFTCAQIAKSERCLKTALTRNKPLEKDTLEHFLANCERYPAFKEKMLAKVQDFCRRHPRRLKTISYRLQQRILEMK